MLGQRVCAFAILMGIAKFPFIGAVQVRPPKSSLCGKPLWSWTVVMFTQHCECT